MYRYIMVFLLSNTWYSLKILRRSLLTVLVTLLHAKHVHLNQLTSRNSIKYIVKVLADMNTSYQNMFAINIKSQKHVKIHTRTDNCIGALMIQKYPSVRCLFQQLERKINMVVILINKSHNEPDICFQIGDDNMHILRYTKAWESQWFIKIPALLQTALIYHRIIAITLCETKLWYVLADVVVVFTD